MKNEIRKKNQEIDYWEVQRLIDKQVTMIENEKESHERKRWHFSRDVLLHVKRKTAARLRKWQQWFKCLF